MKKQPLLGLLCASVLIMVHLTKERARRVLKSHLVQLQLLMKSRGRATDWRSHNHIKEAQVQSGQPPPSRAYPETSHQRLLSEAGGPHWPGEESFLYPTWLLNPKQPAKGHAQGWLPELGHL